MIWRLLGPSFARVLALGVAEWETRITVDGSYRTPTINHQVLLLFHTRTLSLIVSGPSLPRTFLSRLRDVHPHLTSSPSRTWVFGQRPQQLVW